MYVSIVWYLVPSRSGLQDVKEATQPGSIDMQILSIYGEPDSLDVGAYLGNDVISV